MKKSKYAAYAPAVLLVLLGLVLVWRAFYGVNYNDEMYYADCLYRLYRGDVYLVQDWQMHLMSMVPVYPFYVLFRLVRESNEGVILYLRILYVIFQTAVACFVYLRLRKRERGALLVSLVYLLFTPFNIAALSYNTLGIGFALLSFCILCTPDEKHPVRDPLFCGICVAFCILANPFALALYLLYGAVQVLRAAVGREKKLLVPFFWMSVGAFAVFLIFCLILFQRASLGELRLTFSYNFHIPGYEQNAGQWMRKFTSYFEKLYPEYRYLFWVTGGALLLSCLDRKCREHAFAYVLPVAALAGFYLWYHGFLQQRVPTNFCMVPLSLTGLLCFRLLRKKDYRYLGLWFVPGVLYSLCSHFASDTGILCITSCYVLSSSVSALFLTQFIQEQREALGKWGRGAAVCAALLLMLQLGISGCLRITFFYNEAPLSELTEKVTDGPAKGLYTTSGMAEFHSERVRELESLQLTEQDVLLVMNMEPWAYLCTDAAVANYTCWGEFYDSLYDVYQFFFPRKTPTVVYCTDYEESMREKPELMQRYLDAGYEMTDLGTSVVLRKP